MRGTRRPSNYNKIQEPTAGCLNTNTRTGDGCNAGARNCTVQENKHFLQGPKNKKLRMRKSVPRLVVHRPEIGNRGSTYILRFSLAGVLCTIIDPSGENLCRQAGCACWLMELYQNIFCPSPLSTPALHERYMDEHGIDVHCLVPLPWLECEPALHADETRALEVNGS